MFYQDKYKKEKNIGDHKKITQFILKQLFLLVMHL